MVLPCHERLPLSSPIRRLEWHAMTRWCFGNGSAAGVRRCSGSVPTVTAGSVTVRHPAVCKRAASSGAVRIVVTNRVPKAGKTIVTGNVSIGIAAEAELA